MTVSFTREEYDDAKFENAFQIALQMPKREFPAYIDGMTVASGVEYPIESPIDSSIRFGIGQEQEVGAEIPLVEAAKKAYATWSKTAMDERIPIFEKLFTLMFQQRYRLAANVLLASGMTRKEALAEVDALLEILAREINRAKDVKLKPMGVWAIVSTYSSPLTSPASYALLAILAGNTVACIADKYCPLPMYMIYDMCNRSGIPAGVFNIMTDRKYKTMLDLANSMEIAGVVASGTGKVMEDMMFLGVDDELRFVNEIKGMNPILVYRPSDMEKAVNDVIDSAFRYSGQGLFSTSKVIVTIEEQRKFTDLLITKLKALRITDPAETDAFCGPMISKEASNDLQNLVANEAEFLMFGGDRIYDDYTSAGYYHKPVVVTGLTDEDDNAFMDPSGMPFLFIRAVADLDEAMEEMAYTEFGLSVGVYSKDSRIAERLAQDNEIPRLFTNVSSRTLSGGIYAKLETFSAL